MANIGARLLSVCWRVSLPRQLEKAVRERATLDPATGKKPGASSARDVRPPVKGKPMKRGTSSHITPEQQAELEALAAMPEEDIDSFFTIANY
jgi:hypothetical protein